MKKITPRQQGINCLLLFDVGRARQRACLAHAARRLADRFAFPLETSDVLPDVVDLTQRDWS